jgi:RNA polymerase sigma factor (sigma-70 family)
MDSPSTNREDTRPAPLFPDTLWPLVLAAKASDPAKAQAAISELCHIYRKPIVNWLRGYGCKEDAEDMASAFIIRWHERNHLINFNRKEDVKFRSFLLTCLRRFVKDERAKPRAVRRNEGIAPVPLEDEDVPQEAELARELDRAIAMSMHERVSAALAKHNPGRFEELRRLLFGLDRSISYSEVGSRLGISEGAVKAAVARLRDAYYETFRTEAAQIARPGELDEEIQYLLGLLGEVD